MTGTAESQTLNELLQRLRTHLPDLAARYQIASLGVFGSYLREQQRSGSEGVNWSSVKTG